ncbi:MAG: hypothetical protein WA435_01510 [Gallionellaceae bacterium]
MPIRHAGKRDTTFSGANLHRAVFFYRSTYLDEPNLFDTWHAVAALALLGEQPPHVESIVHFVCM